MPRMMVYAWFDQDSVLKETKFGDHFVSSDMSYEDAVAHTATYIRTQFPRRGQHFDSGRVLYHVWDVSDPAKQLDKFYGGSKMDDVIRPSIGFSGTQGKEFHQLSLDEVVVAVNEWIRKTQQPLPEVGLAAWQYNSAVNVLQAIQQGKRTIVAELCARFGKTIWGGVLARELGVQVTIVASYVQTVMTSFKKDLTSYQQFRDFVIVDTKDEDFQEQIAHGVAEGKQVIALISMCKGSKRQNRIDHLFSLPFNRLVLIDEADFGAHKDGQTTPFKNGRKKDDVIVLMTGTNGDRAAATWDVDHYLSVVYPELIMEKRG